MRVVILVPRRSDGGRRDELWAWVKDYLTAWHPDWEIFEGDNPLSEGLFNRSLAINRAARAAGDWDVAIVHDGDNIVHPRKLVQAVEQAAADGVMTYAHDTYLYMDAQTSDEILADPDGMWFPRPQIQNVRPGYAPYIIHKHISGVQAVPRAVWDATGGFMENLSGWGSDDSIFAVLCNLFGGGVKWVGPSSALHFWHPHSKADTDKQVVAANRRKLLQLKALERRGDRKGARAFLAELGHTVP